ncbi:hypothetical protein FIV42_07235 [Persicimonas caeni]|uniref:Uncharacterized protein n=1 Tax=Persicimonas caeni TaxID=2292766 RepID=A0A4Y6PQB7_PERCE|nr:hypothetical protein [Persicimonas caeni]QDG50532.1 hypothetical protein FIV42_07235 [Persicimonas caeni]QED31753.1 hypothetical protein FRD00_07230 [Persicimonas caeni]
MRNLSQSVCLSLVVAISLSFAGCQEDGADQDAVERARQHDACVNSDGEFVKPDNPNGNNPFLRVESGQNSGFQKGRKFRNFARPHMESYSGLDNWLYEGEHFVMDIGRVHYGVGDIDGTMMVLLNFEPVLFKVTEVSSADGYPSIADLELEDEDSLVMQQSMTFEDGVPFNGTLAVPASSFTKGAGAYDLRVVFIPDVTPSEETGFDPYLKAIPGYAYRVFYGGCEPTRSPSIREATTESASWTPLTKNLVDYSDFLFLTPPDSVYSWEEVAGPNDIQLYQRFQSADETLELTLYSLLTEIDEERGIDVEDVVYMVFEGDQIFDTFRMKPAFEGDYGTRDYYASTDQKPVARIEIPTAGKDAAQYTVVAFLNPAGAPVVGAPIGVKTSNTLSFEFVGE